MIFGDITPAMCEEYLAHSNNLNRELSKAKVKKYVVEMQNGSFDTTRLFEGKLFYIDVDGELVSAQHRMKAAVEANFTFQNALTVVVDRDLFNTKSVEARSPKDIAQMALKVLDPDVKKSISNAIHAVCGQRVCLEARKPFVTKRPQSYEQEELLDMYIMQGENLQAILNSAPKTSQGALSALACMLYAGIVDLERAIELAQNPALKPKEGSAILHWTNAMCNEVQNKETKFNTEKVYL